MSIYSGFQSIRKERATLERNRVVMSSMMEDAKINDAWTSNFSQDFFEGVDDSEIEELIARIPESDPSDEDAEVERILMSDNDMDVDGILGVEDSPSVEDE